MNYSDFPDLQTDDFCGTRFGDQGQLEVIGFKMHGRRKIYTVQCLCKQSRTFGSSARASIRSWRCGCVEARPKTKSTDARKTCTVCRKKFQPTHRAMLTCSETCRSTRQTGRKRSARESRPYCKNPDCKKRFRSTSVLKVYCSSSCREQLHRLNRLALTPVEKENRTVQLILELQDACTSRGYTFKGFIGKVGRAQPITVHCNDHGDFLCSTSWRWLNLNPSCPVCVNKAFSEAYVMCIHDGGEHPVGLKFGITNSTLQRLGNLNYNNPLTFSVLRSYRFESYVDCRNAEAEVSRSVTTSIFRKCDMPDGYTETTYCYNMERICAIYEKHGGVLIT